MASLQTLDLTHPTPTIKLLSLLCKPCTSHKSLHCHSQHTIPADIVNTPFTFALRPYCLSFYSSFNFSRSINVRHTHLFFHNISSPFASRQTSDPYTLYPFGAHITVLSFSILSHLLLLQSPPIHQSLS